MIVCHDVFRIIFKISKINYVKTTRLPDSMFKELLYKTVYVLMHGIFTVFELIHCAVKKIGDNFVDFYHEYGAPHRTNFFKKELKRQIKIPKHVTVLLGKEEPSFKDLANIIIWCMVNQVSFVSFYDCKGALKKDQDKLEKELKIKLLPEEHVIWHNSPGSTYKNGTVGRKIHVKILTENDNRNSFVTITKTLVKSKDSTDISIENVDMLLHKQYEFPEPDLGLYCGKSLNFFEYPPWQIRVTEFFGINSHHGLSFRKFMEQLYLYSKREQRLGK